MLPREPKMTTRGDSGTRERERNVKREQASPYKHNDVIETKTDPKTEHDNIGSEGLWPTQHKDFQQNFDTRSEGLWPTPPKDFQQNILSHTHAANLKACVHIVRGAGGTGRQPLRSGRSPTKSRNAVFELREMSYLMNF